MRVKSITRSACSISWCPVERPDDASKELRLPDGRVLNHHSLLSLGKRQSMDDAFESHCELEIIDTSPATRSSSIGRVICPTSSFLSIDWGVQSKHKDKFPLGLIAGGMEDGTVSIWNPLAIISDKDKGTLSRSSLAPSVVTKAQIHQSKVHTRSVSCVAWNPKENKYLASVGYDGQLYVWDFKHLSKPAAFKPPTGQPQSDGAGGSTSGGSALSTVAWNPNVPYILAAASSIGETQIYDLRAQKIALNIRARTMTAVSSVVWNPSYARELCISYANNTAEIWDLKQPMSPKLFLEGRHRRNILDLSWNPHDSRVIFTTAEDNRGYLWNSRNGQCLMSPESSPMSGGYGGRPGESSSMDASSQGGASSLSSDPFVFDSVNFEAEWCPLRAGVLATSGSNGTISIFDVRDVCYEGSTEAEEFMRKPLNYTRPLSGVCFGFGGKFAHFGNETVEVSKTLPDGKVKTSKKTLAPRLHVSRVPIEQSVIDRAQDFERMLQSFGDERRLQQLTDEKISLNRKNKSDTELQTWRLLQLFQNTAAADCKEQMLNFLGYSDPSSQLDSPVKETVPVSSLAAVADSSSAADVAASASSAADSSQNQVPSSQATRASGSGFDGEFLDESSDGTGDFDSILQTSASLLSPRSEEIAKRAMEGDSGTVAATAGRPAAISSKYGSSLPEFNSEDSPAGFGDEMDDEDFFGQLSELAAASSVTTTTSSAAEPVSKDTPIDSSLATPVNEEEPGMAEDAKLSDDSALQRKFDMENDIDVQIKQCLIRANYRQAAMIALNGDRVADALIFAHCGGPSLFDELRRLYFENHKQKFIANVFEHIVYNTYDEYVSKSDLSEWKETLAIILQFVTDESRCNELCNELAQRCRRSGIVIGATACLMCSNNIEILINLWTNPNTGIQQRKDANLGSSEDQNLQKAIEKVLVFVNSEWSQSQKQQQQSPQISSLTDILKEYASLLANAGSLKTAADLLGFLTDASKCAVFSKINTAALTDLLRRISQADPSLQIALPSSAAATIQNQLQPGPSSSRPSAHMVPGPSGRPGPQIGGRPQGGRRPQRPPPMTSGGRGSRPGPSSRPGPGGPRPGPNRPGPPQTIMNDASLMAQSGGAPGIPAPPVSGAAGPRIQGRPQPGPGTAKRPPSGGRGRRGRPPAGGAPPSSRPPGPAPIASQSSSVSQTQPMTSQPVPQPMHPVAAAPPAVGGSVPVSGGPSPSARTQRRPLRAGRRPPPTGAGRGRGSAPSSAARPGGRPPSVSGAVSSSSAGAGGPISGAPSGRLPPTGGRGAPRMGRGRGGPPPSSSSAAAAPPSSSSVASGMQQGRPQPSQPMGSSQMPPARAGRGRGPPMGGRGRRGPPPGPAAAVAPGMGPMGGRSQPPSQPARMQPHRSQPRSGMAPPSRQSMGRSTTGAAGAPPSAGVAPVRPEPSPGPVPIASPTEFGNTTQGTGFYGETSLKRKSAADSAPLPADAVNIVDDVLNYVSRFSSMSLTMSEQRTANGLSSKFGTLRQAIQSGSLSYSVYSEVCEISSLLHSRQYDQSLKIVTKMVQDPSNFRLHKKWLSAFKALIVLAKKYSV